MKRLIKTYNDLLKKDPVLAKECADQFNESMVNHHVIFGDRVLSNLLRPFFIPLKEIKRIKEINDTLMNCAEKMIRFTLESKKIAEKIRLTKEEDDLIAFENGYPRSIIICRSDAFYYGSGDIKFLEFNADSPGGIGYSDVMSKIYLELPVFKLLKKKYHYCFYPFDSRKYLLKSLLDCYQGFGKKQKPTIGLIGWEKIKIRPDFYLISDYIERQGFKTVIADPRALESRKGGLFFKDQRIDIVYRKVLAFQILRKSDELKGFIRAYKERSACFVNPLNSFLLSLKVFFYILTDEHFSFLFTKKERRIIQRVIPWTRKLEDAKTEYRGRKIDLLNYIIKYKDRFILKPSDQFAAVGIFLGSEAKQSVWEKSIKKGLKQRYVVQERVRLPSEVFPLSSHLPSFEKRNLNLGLFALGGQWRGGITRFSSSPIINAIGGGALPIIKVGRK